MLEFALFILSGFLSGILGGMGMGGGTLLIPILTTFFSVSQKTAQAVNLITFIPMAIVAIIIHLKNKVIDKKGLLLVIIPALILGGLGAYLASVINADFLKKSFGIFLMALSIVQFLGAKSKK